jgi:hypothetical protein
MKYFILLAFIYNGNYLYSQSWTSNNVIISNPFVYLNSDANNIYIGGDITNVNDTTTYMFCSWNGSKVNRYNQHGINGSVMSSIIYNDTLIIGGAFTYIDSDTLCKMIARWDGSEWKPMGAGFNGSVTNMKIFNNELYVVGWFNKSGTIPLNGIAKWDGHSWVNVYHLPQYNENMLYDACFYKNELYVGGNFHSYDTNNIRDIAKWNGQSWESVGGGIQGDMGINRMVVYHDKLVVAGLFYKQYGNAGNFIMTWDGQQWEELGGGTWGQLNNLNSLGTIYDMQVYNDKLYICGLFNYAGTTPASHVAVWDGERWCGYPGVFDNSVYAMTIFNDTIYIACGMTIDGDTVYNFARWGGGLVPDTCGSVGISHTSYDKENILVYPNPCGAYLILESAGQNFSDGFIEIVDYTGKKYGIKKEIMDGKIRINTQSLAQGIYLLKITSGNSVYSCKFIKL